MPSTNKQISEFERKAIRKAFLNFTRHSYRDAKTGRFKKKPERVMEILVGMGTYQAISKLFEQEMFN